MDGEATPHRRQPAPWLGDWLFRWRSFVPAVLLLVLLGGALLEAHRRVPSPPPLWWAFAGLVSLAGLAVRVFTFGAVPREDWARHRFQWAERLNTLGPYSLVRHPLYLGNVLNAVGMLLAPGIWWLGVATGTVLVVFFGLIIRSEDAFLRQRFGAEHEEWARRTPLLLPDPRLWRPAPGRFAWRQAVRSEYLTLHTIVLVFLLLWLLRRPDALSHWPPPAWWLLAVANSALCLGIRRGVKRRRSG